LVKGAVLRALQHISDKPPHVIDELLQLLSHPSAYVRAGAAYAFRPLGNDNVRIINALLPMLSDSTWHVREQVAYTLASALSEVEVIGERLEELLRQQETLLQRDLIYPTQIYQALQEIAEKLALKNT